MPVEITPEVEQLVHAIYIDGGFVNETEALRQYRTRQQLVADVNSGVAQLDNGEYAKYDTNSRQRFRDDILAESKRRASTNPAP